MRSKVRAVPGWLAIAVLAAVCVGVDVEPVRLAAPPATGHPVHVAQWAGCGGGVAGRTPLPWQPPDEATREKLERLFTAYFAVDAVTPFRDWVLLKTALRGLPDEGRSLLADIPGLRRMLYRVRSYDPVFGQDETMKDGERVERVIEGADGILDVVREEVHLSLALPPAYVAARDAGRLDAVGPFPMIVSLHDSGPSKDAPTGPGFTRSRETLERRWSLHGPSDSIRRSFILFAPAAPGVGFLEDGNTRSERVPLNLVWKRYPVDFDRIVIEGGSDALLFATSYPVFYAGVIVRDAGARISPRLVRNLAGMPIFVVGPAGALADDLFAGGHPTSRVTHGDAAGLIEWLGTVRRCLPTSFSWTCEDDSAHRLAHWVHLDQVDPAAAERTLRVEVVDTSADPNTIRLFSHGIRSLTLFLNDEILDLDRPVRVVVNGRVVPEAFVGTHAPTRVGLPARFDRTLNMMLDRQGLSIRKSRYLGWLFPVVLEGIEVPK